MRSACMVMLRLIKRIFQVVDNRVKQYFQSLAFSCAYRHDRYPEHLRHTVEVYSHPPFLNDIHHVQCQHYRLAQLYQLQCQVEIAFKAGSVGNVYYCVNVVPGEEIARDLLLHCIGGQ